MSDLLAMPALSVDRVRRGQAIPHPRVQPKLVLPNTLPSAQAPTISITASNAANPITGAVRQAPWQHPAFTFLGVEMRQYTSGGDTNSVESQVLTGSSTPQSPRGVIEFETDADKVSFKLLCSNTGFLSYRVWVDDMPVTWTNSAGTGNGNSPNYLLIDWATPGLGRAPRRVKVEWQQARLLGVYADVRTSFWKSSRPRGPIWAVMGDSFTEGTGASWGWDAWCQWAGHYLGWDMQRIPVGGTGYLAAPAGKSKYRDRILDIPSYADGVIFAGGWNDMGSYVDADFRAEARALHDATLALNRPALQILQMGPFSVTQVTSGTAVQVNLRNALKDASAATNTIRPGAVVGFIDPLGGYPAASDAFAGTQWMSGDVSGTRPNGTGNCDDYISGDNVHPNAAGHKYLGYRFASAVVAAGLA